MKVTMYRKHNRIAYVDGVETVGCTSKDSQHCKPADSYCPIYVRGTGPDGQYVRGPIKSILKTTHVVRDWKEATKLVEAWKEGKPSISNASIEKWRDDYLANAAHENLSSETIRKHAYMFKMLVAFAQKNNIYTVRGFDVATTRSFRATWSVSPRTSRAMVTTLRSLMKFAISNKWLAENPAKELKVKVPDSDARPFTDDEMKSILTAAKSDPRAYAFIRTMRASGLRISDVTRLAISELGDDNHLRLIQTKTRMPVDILIGDADAAILRSAAELNPNKKFFFQTGAAKPTAAACNWSDTLKEVFRAAGVPDGHSHMFRHTYAEKFLKMGKSIQDLAKILGHKSVNTTIKHYDKWTKGRQERLDVEMSATHDWCQDVEGAPKNNVRQMGSNARKA
jgi:integrase/recombinase XerD